MRPEEEPNYREVLEALPIGFYLVDRDRRITLWSEGAERITGYLEQEMLGRCCRDDLLLHCNGFGAVLCGESCPLSQTMRDGKPRETEVFALHSDGFRVPVRVRAAPVRNRDGAIVGAAECFEETVSAATPAAGESVDGATGLPGHAAMAARLRAALDDYAATGVPFGALLMSVDQTEGLRRNDGRNAVDAVLFATGQTLARNAGPGESAGRWSGDRFLYLLKGCAAGAVADAGRRLQRIAKMESIPWWGDRLSVELSAGGALARRGDTAESLAARVEAALERAVANGGGEVVMV